MLKLESNGFIFELNTEDLDVAMGLADAEASYNQSGMAIMDNDDNVIASRTWYGCMDGIEDQENPISYGTFGFYADWQQED